ncbi:3-deoxy-D-manno-octulosonic-acid transferase [Candidatus Methylomirabilis lanthanidiphila]|uniref:3-deoxy-D-manno-octulosonic acid transferase n=1 Tax=Candidatus Methylomirabilis lanthanidiphila TaxID=2211376 RepID=A0A564ZMV1_9BACT|nr:3-deoxy-D-manno-octulosonic acid transferase [Candidatus Methylomirabilis lanthanidiphila]VUZ85972.1 3-deoxy-D-manno-octulosonic-acid transferase [Candidatus Methylomirabilis lanthanidiphila]
MTLMYAAYSFLLTLGLLCWSPFILLKMLRRSSYREGWSERVGRYPQALFLRLRPVQPIWIHAVSVGEVGAASVLANRWRACRPMPSFVVSTVTGTGREVARRSLPQAAAVVYFPIDLPMMVHRSLATVRPRLILLTETEIWPNFLRACANSKIPVAIINGRLSERSFLRYRLIRPFICRVLQRIDLFCMQTSADAERMLALGANPERVHIVGNLKFDAVLHADTSSLAEQWRRELQIDAQRQVLVAGSTHPGEDEVLLEAFRRLRGEFQDLLLILAPRHPERVAQVETTVAGQGLAAVRRSALPRGGNGAKEVIVLDTVGELSGLYAVGSISFIGGSLISRGGHNLLEPALHGRPVLFGPHMENFSEASAYFVERGAAIQVNDTTDLVRQVARLLRDPAERAMMGQAALAALAAHRGACERTVTLLERFVL